MAGRGVTSVHISITTRCNRHCPECSYGMSCLDRDRHDHPFEYLKDAGRRLELPKTPEVRVTITGGEPSLHQQFQELAPCLRSILNANSIGIESNGYGFKKFPEAFLHFDQVHASPYDGTFGGPSNLDDISFMRNFFTEHGRPDDFISGPALIHWPRNSWGSRPCFRGDAGTVIYFDGKLYGCCAASGQPNKVGCDITPTWRDDVVNLPLPCKGCPFAT